MDQFHYSRHFCADTRRQTQHRDFEIFAHVVAICGHADRCGLEGGKPEQFFDPLIDLALVGGGGRAVLKQQLLWHALIHTAGSR